MTPATSRVDDPGAALVSFLVDRRHGENRAKGVIERGATVTPGGV